MVVVMVVAAHAVDDWVACRKYLGGRSREFSFNYFSNVEVCVSVGEFVDAYFLAIAMQVGLVLAAATLLPQRLQTTA